MGYRNRDSRIIHINELADECGLFTSDTEQNNGYGCLSKSKRKDIPGCCYDFDCPLAVSADLEDMKEHDQELYEEWKDYPEDPSENGADYVIQHSEVV